jgi:hypothetical protein
VPIHPGYRGGSFLRRCTLLSKQGMRVAQVRPARDVHVWSQWYTKKELAQRNAIFYSGSLISGAFGNLIAAGILNGLDGSMGMSAWQWYYSNTPVS